MHRAPDNKQAGNTGRSRVEQFADLRFQRRPNDVQLRHAGWRSVMYYSIALGFVLALAAFGIAAFVADRRYRRTFLPPEAGRAAAGGFWRPRTGS